MDVGKVSEVVLGNMMKVVDARTEESTRTKLKGLMNEDGTISDGNVVKATLRIVESELCEVLIRSLADLLP